MVAVPEGAAAAAAVVAVVVLVAAVVVVVLRGEAFLNSTSVWAFCWLGICRCCRDGGAAIEIEKNQVWRVKAITNDLVDNHRQWSER